MLAETLGKILSPSSSSPSASAPAASSSSLSGGQALAPKAQRPKREARHAFTNLLTAKPPGSIASSLAMQPSRIRPSLSRTSSPWSAARFSGASLLTSARASRCNSNQIYSIYSIRLMRFLRSCLKEDLRVSLRGLIEIKTQSRGLQQVFAEHRARGPSCHAQGGELQAVPAVHLLILHRTFLERPLLHR